ncbi:hypothetical protein F5Y05DRAFT_423139 [Hypoxylon sp. FL0543]|nr:hypothetical protein F5Y05DRAFT_423139 [Hypoxylon sp. FL0543]
MAYQWGIIGWVKFVVLLLLAQTGVINGLSWGRQPKMGLERQAVAKPITAGGIASQVMGSGSRMPSSYEVALNELRELESEPLCHRTAARLLVNNCELLEGKDEATFLTDSGRKIRDFVDSYAASLAICDLERGSFHIPRECAKFREPVLNQLPLQNLGQLHNTWVSYRHKALRFCEAARVDHEKAQHILLFQRLTKVMGRFTDDVDKQFEQRLKDLDLRADATGGRIDELSPKVDRLKDSLKSLEDMFLSRIILSAKETTDAVNSGKDNALNLQRMLEVVFKTVLEGQAEVASSYETSMQAATQHTESVVGTAMEVVIAVTESAAQLRSQLELAKLRAMELESRQENLEHGMKRLVGISEVLATQYNDHTDLLLQASNITNEILDTLEDTAASATFVGNSISKQWSTSSWWPYIWCPAASLVLGSYGLPPSAMRNVALLALGEIAGFTYSSIQSLPLDFTSLQTNKLSTLIYVWGSSSGNSSEDASPTSDIHTNITTRS